MSKIKIDFNRFMPIAYMENAFECRHEAHCIREHFMKMHCNSA